MDLLQTHQFCVLGTDLMKSSVSFIPLHGGHSWEAGLLTLEQIHKKMTDMEVRNTHNAVHARPQAFLWSPLQRHTDTHTRTH